VALNRWRVIVAVCWLLCGCGAPPATDPPQATAGPAFVAKVWLSTDASAAPGTLRIFLPNGMLLMDSCGETYRLARWRAIDDRRIEWQEDAARIEAETIQNSASHLQLRLRLVDGFKEETYRVAEVPFVCPDMPR
jgi:hypothetical protein